MSTVRIQQNHPVRKAFSGCSTGNSINCYYKTKGHAFCAYDEALADFGFHLDCVVNNAWTGDEGRRTVDVYDSCNKHVGCAVFYYYRMPSGNYEFVAYLA